MTTTTPAKIIPGEVVRPHPRVLRMVEQGAYDEIAAFEALHPSDDLPATRAVGVPEFRAWVRGSATKEETIAAVQQSTRQYAKRQFTWFAHQPPPAWERHDKQLDDPRNLECATLLLYQCLT